jgi:hypothetical protein
MYSTLSGALKNALKVGHPARADKAVSAGCLPRFQRVLHGCLTLVPSLRLVPGECTRVRRGHRTGHSARRLPDRYQPPRWHSRASLWSSSTIIRGMKFEGRVIRRCSGSGSKLMEQAGGWSRFSPREGFEQSGLSGVLRIFLTGQIMKTWQGIGCPFGHNPRNRKSNIDPFNPLPMRLCLELVKHETQRGDWPCPDIRTL